MKGVFFIFKKTALFLLFAIVLISYAHASLELVSNTSQCLTDCKAVLHITPGTLASNIGLPSQPNSSFKIDFVKPLNRTQVLNQSVQLCNNETVARIIPVYKEQQVEVPCVPDKNGQIGEPPCFENKSVFKENKTVFETNYVCQNFFGATIDKAKEYWIEIIAKKKPVLGNNPVDWQLTFNERQYSEWAWWNSSWHSKMPINICANTDLNVGQLIWVKGINFSLLDVETDLHDVRVVNETTNTDIPRLVQGTSTSIDGNLFFALDQNILKNNSPCDTNFAMYYDNSLAGAVLNSASNTDGFENYVNDVFPQGAWKNYAGGTGASTVCNITVKTGNKAACLTGTSRTIGADWNAESIVQSNDKNLLGKTWDYNVWFKTDLSTTYGKATYFSEMYCNPTCDFTALGSVVFATDGSIYDNETNPHSHLLDSRDGNTWYKVQFTYALGSKSHKTCLYDNVGALILCDANTAITNATLGGIPQSTLMLKTGLVGAAAVTGQVFFDDVTFFAPYQTNISLNTEETSGNAVDVNLSSWHSIDANTYTKNGQSYMINFDVYSKDANAIATLFDINFSESRIEGTGTVIINDGNVASTPKFYCDSNDFSRADYTKTTCHYNWTINTSFDGNAYLILKAIQPTDSNLVFSDSNFSITSIAKYTILIPKDEKTLVLISPYSLRITGGLDLNWDSLATNWDINWLPPITTVYIDINATGYSSRRYTITDTSELFAPPKTIQPYLTALGSETFETTITVLGSITGSGIVNVSIVSSKMLGETDTNMESHTTDSAGRTLFHFYQGDTYTLRYYINGVIQKTESYTAISSVYTTYLDTQFQFPSIVSTPYADINFAPSTMFAVAKDNNFLDLNQFIAGHFQNIMSIDVNVFYGLDKNMYSDTNTSITTSGWFHQDINLNANHFDYNALLHVWIKIRFADGNTQFVSKIYTIIPSPNIMGCTFSGSGRWNNQMILTCWQSWRQNVTFDFGNTLNNDNPAKIVTSFLAVLFAFLACIGLASAIGLDSTNAGFVFVSILGFFWLIQWILPELFFLAVFVFIVILIMKATIWR